MPLAAFRGTGVLNDIRDDSEWPAENRERMKNMLVGSERSITAGPIRLAERIRSNAPVPGERKDFPVGRRRFAYAEQVARATQGNAAWPVLRRQPILRLRVQSFDS